MSRSQHVDAAAQPQTQPQTIDERRKGIIKGILEKMAETYIEQEVEDPSEQALVHRDFVENVLPVYVPIMLQKSKGQCVSVRALMAPYLDEIRDFLYQKMKARKEQAAIEEAAREQAARQQADRERADREKAYLARIENFPSELEDDEKQYQEFKDCLSTVVSAEVERQKAVETEIADIEMNLNCVRENTPALFNDTKFRAEEKRMRQLRQDNRTIAIVAQAQINYLLMTIGHLSSTQTLTALNHRSFEAINLYLENLKIVSKHYAQYSHPPYFPEHVVRLTEHIPHARENFSILSSPKLADLFASLTHNAHRLSEKQIDAAIKEHNKQAVDSSDESVESPKESQGEFQP